MKKLENGKITFNSTIEHRLVERVRHQLKKAGMKDIKTIHHDEFTWIMSGRIYNDEILKVYVLMRTIETDYVSMNRTFYDLERVRNDNPLLVLADRRHIYPVKYMWFDKINQRIYTSGSTPLVLFPEVDFKKYQN